MIPMSSDDDFLRNLYEVHSHWQKNIDDICEKDYSEAASLVYYYEHRYFSRSEDIHEKIMGLAKMMAQSTLFDASDPFVRRMANVVDQLCVYDALGKNPMMPLWIESGDKRLLEVIREGVSERFSDTLYRLFSKHGTSQDYVSKGFAKKGQALAKEARLLDLNGDYMESKFSGRKKMGASFKSIKNIFVYGIMSDSESKIGEYIRVDRLSQKMIEIGGIPNLYPGVLSFLHKDAP